VEAARVVSEVDHLLSGAKAKVKARGLQVAWAYLSYHNRREITATFFLPSIMPTFRIWVETSPLGCGLSITDISQR